MHRQYKSLMADLMLQVLLCLFYRSVTLVGEKERKILKDIVKKARTPLKTRILPQGKGCSR